MILLGIGGVWLFMPYDISAQESGIHFFKGSWEEVLQESRKEGKPIFVDAYAVWCGPCRWMEKNVFTREDVGMFYNKHFVNYKFDMEKGEGPEFARKYRVTAYPTFLYLDQQGNVRYRILGGRAPEDFIQEGKKALAQFKAEN